MHNHSHSYVVPHGNRDNLKIEATSGEDSHLSEDDPRPTLNCPSQFPHPNPSWHIGKHELLRSQTIYHHKRQEILDYGGANSVKVLFDQA